MAKKTNITLCIRETGTGAQQQFTYDALVDGSPVAGNLSLAPPEARAARDFSAQFNSLFERRPRVGVLEDDLNALGAELFRCWLESVWAKIEPKIPARSHRALVIASESADVLNLPWELLRLPGGDFLGLDARYSVRRFPRPKPGLPEFTGELPAPPVRILFSACATQDQPQLDYEREEEWLFKAISKAGPNVAFESCDHGTFEELQERVDDFKPHIVHLTGHGAVKDDGLGYFAFEDERGKTDERSSVEIRERVFRGSDVQCVFVSGCQTGKAPPVKDLGGICQGLVGDEIPLAVGWAASIADDLATRFAEKFYSTIAAGRPIDRALTQARQAIRPPSGTPALPAWTLPVLYCASSQDLVYDLDPQRAPVPPARPSVVQRPLPGMTEGYAEHFVGMRRELQRLLPPLREGELQVVILTGIGGAGKSTLATRLARKLEAEGFKPIPLPSSTENPLTAAAILEACGDALCQAAREHEARGDSQAAGELQIAAKDLDNPQIPVDARLRDVVSISNRHRFLLVLDNFEVNLNEDSRRIIAPDIAGFCTHLLGNLSGESRALITSRYLPAEVSALPRTAYEQSLKDFAESSFFKFLWRDEAVEQRLRKGELPHDLLTELHRLLGGTPRFLAQIREVLKTISAAELEHELAEVKMPSGAKPGALQQARDRYCEDIFTARLYGRLSPDSQKALSRAAVYGIPVNLAGLAAVSGEPVNKLRDFTREWQDYALVCLERERTDGELWIVYGLLRTWLLAEERLSTADRRAAHRAAADFLRDLNPQDVEGELGLSWMECLTEARAQYLSAADWAQARETTDRMSGRLVVRALYDDVLWLNEDLLRYEEHPRPMNWIGRAHDDRAEYAEARRWYDRALKVSGAGEPEEAASAWHGLASIDLREGSYGAAREKFGKSLAMQQAIGDRAGEAATWHNLATIDLNEGNYGAARENFGKSLKIKQAIGDRAGEARTWHNLATMDLNEGNYGAARENFGKSLAIQQAIGDRAGEAATFYQLAYVAAKMGRPVEGLPLVAVCFLIDQAIGHGEAKSDLAALADMASEAGYTPEQLEAVLKEAAEAYKEDRGLGLLKAAFPDE